MGMGTVFLIGGAAVGSLVVSKIMESRGRNPHTFEVSFGAAVAVVAIYKVLELVKYVVITFI